MCAASQVRLAHERSLAPGCDNALGGGPEASYLRETDAHREVAIDIEGNDTARWKRLRAPLEVGLPRICILHALHARVDE